MSKTAKKTAARRSPSRRSKNPLSGHPLLERRLAGQLAKIDGALRAIERDARLESVGINAEIASTLRGALEGVRARVARIYTNA